MNSTAQKNELIFTYSSGNLGEAKSLFVSMYLYLNSLAAKKASIFENILADNIHGIDDVAHKNLDNTDCIKDPSNIENKVSKLSNPLSNLIWDLNNISWKSVYKGFKEFNIPVNDNDSRLHYGFGELWNFE